MSKLPWIILGKRYKYEPNDTSYIFVFTSYDQNKGAYNFDFIKNRTGARGETFWFSSSLKKYKHLFTLLDRPKIEDDPEYKDLFV